MNGGVDTRPLMTRAEFEAAAVHAHDDWWLTGEDRFIHVPSVMEVDGWNVYGHPGNERLTEPQRVLMMWSDLVGQTQNGGFTQFVDNFAPTLALAHRLIARIGWPDMFERFDRAFREQAKDPGNPRPPLTGLFDPEHWAKGRRTMLRRLARRRLKWWQPATPAAIAAVESSLPDWRLQLMYRDAAAAGEVEPLPMIPPRCTEAADAFTNWFYRKDTKEASKVHVGDYIVRHRDALCRLTD